jgi:aspartyl protease family protein
MKNRFIIIAVIAFILILFLKQYTGPVSFENETLMNVVYSVVVISALIVSIFNSKVPFKQLLKSAGTWVLIIGVLLIGFSYKSDIRKVYNKVYANLIPGNYITTGDKQVIVYANQYGHYYVNTIVQGVKIDFLIDTGATTVSLTRSDAEKLGINLNQLNYSQKVSTANGMALSAPIKLDYIQINDIIVNDVSASVGSDDGLEKSLLGMSFLNKLKLFQVTEDSLQMVGE